MNPKPRPNPNRNRNPNPNSNPNPNPNPNLNNPPQVRTLLKGGITPVAGDVKIKRYIVEYAAKLEASSQRG